MAFEITSATDERTLEAYRLARNRVRDLVAYGVYPHVIQAITAYDNLDKLVDDLALGNTNEQALATYHSGLMTPIQDDTDDLLAAAASLVAAIEAIETAVPGTFGIIVPS